MRRVHGLSLSLSVTTMKADWSRSTDFSFPTTSHPAVLPTQYGLYFPVPLDPFQSLVLSITSSYEQVARGRSGIARHLWHQSDTVDQARPYLPPITMAPALTPSEVDELVPAEADSLNPGVFAPDGSRLPPPYRHHVDDNLYADIGPYLLRTVAASVLALYHVLGFPGPNNRDPVSWENLSPLLLIHV